MYLIVLARMWDLNGEPANVRRTARTIYGGQISLLIGVSAAQLLPVVALGLLGGAFADRLDRRRLLVWSEVLERSVFQALTKWLDTLLSLELFRVAMKS